MSGSNLIGDLDGKPVPLGVYTDGITNCYDTGEVRRKTVTVTLLRQERYF